MFRPNPRPDIFTPRDWASVQGYMAQDSLSKALIGGLVAAALVALFISWPVAILLAIGALLSTWTRPAMPPELLAKLQLYLEG